MSISDGPIWSTNSSSPEADTSAYDWILGTKGDTIRIMQARNINSPTATGLPGEICWGSETVLGVTTWYIYLCVGNNDWRRSTFGLLP
jgi:hypothetical protein